ncbi:hypothetical protein GJ496_005782 [Pomphorhynchus laevis]|nr:hypothetical protein GJ496_005782 [Pomphorhynchus laevis]
MMNNKQELITRNLQEVLGKDNINEIISKRPLKIYWGTATTGKPHIGYFVPICKIADFLRAGCEVKILFADLHAYLDNMKAPWDLLQLRSMYYEHIIKAMLRSIGVDLKALQFVCGSEYQLTKEYTLDMYRLTSIVSQHDAKKAGAEVVKQVESPLLSGLLYPCLQALDEQYLDVDAQFGGVDQRKIFTFAEKHLQMLGYRKRIHLMNPIVPSLSGDKMSSSEADGKIDLLDGPEIVKKKLKKAFCEPGKVENNWCLSFSKYAIFPILHNQNKEFEIFQSESKTVLKYMNYIDLEKDYIDTKIHPSDMKESVCSYVNMLLKPIITEFQSTELKELCERAYSDNSKKASNVPKVAASNPVFDEIDLLAFDLRVAKLVDTRTHPRADNLLIHNVVVDKETNKLKTICSNVKPYYKNCVDWPKNQLCIILSNTKPVDIKGIQSSGSILFHCTASSDDKAKLDKIHHYVELMKYKKLESLLSKAYNQDFNE